MQGKLSQEDRGRRLEKGTKREAPFFPYGRYIAHVRQRKKEKGDQERSIVGGG